MNEFVSDNFNISELPSCIYVAKGAGQTIHKNRPYHGLVIKLSGASKYIFDNGDTMEIHSNDVFYLPKMSSYEVVNIEQGDCIAVNFELADENITYPFFKVKSLGNKYKKDFENLLNSWNFKKDGYVNLCYMYLYSIICNIQNDLSARYVPSKSKLLAHSGSEYILQNLSDYTLTIKKIADKLTVSPEYFRKIFYDVYGCAPRKYIIDMRMDKAKNLILSREFSITEISKMCGYDSESYFSSEFKRVCGCRPSEYKMSKS